MKTMLVKDLLASEVELGAVVAQGWVRTKRESKDVCFVELNDGSCLRNLQVVADAGSPCLAALVGVNTGASLRVEGRLAASPGKGQRWELRPAVVEVLGQADATYPLQKKGHSPEFLRSIAHLRPRSNLFGCVFRLRSKLAYGIHRFFQDRGFFYVHTPIVTASDCEGAGEQFRVTTLDLENPPRVEGRIDNARDFFGRPAFLTVSGQLEGEAFATALGRIYTFGPTFRAENSNTPRHASEFWMIEPEMAFCDLQGDMDLAEEFVKNLIAYALDHCAEDMELFAKYVDTGLKERLRFVLERPFRRVPYTEAVDILLRSGKSFEFPVEWGVNLQTEHERFLTEQHFKCPVTVYDFPKAIKPFYMRSNDDGKTVAAMDVLAPTVGEIIGGSQREERLDVLLANMERSKMNMEAYQWYLDTRRYGTVPHAGFGLGFERMLMLLTGVSNIRDVTPFPRTPGNCEF